MEPDWQDWQLLEYPSPRIPLSSPQKEERHVYAKENKGKTMATDGDPIELPKDLLVELYRTWNENQWRAKLDQ